VERPWLEAALSAAAAAVGLLVLNLLTRPSDVDWALDGALVLGFGLAGFIGALIRRRTATKRGND